MPSVIYTNPEMAFVGETEQTCQDKGIKYKKVTAHELQRPLSGRERSRSGPDQALIDSDQNICLAVMSLALCFEIIMSAGILIETQMRIADIKELIFPHPRR